MTDVVPADVSARIQSTKGRISSIRASRKRKLASFYEVTTGSSISTSTAQALADNPPPPHSDNVKFFKDNLVLQYAPFPLFDLSQLLVSSVQLANCCCRGPLLNERHLPTRHIPPLPFSTTPHDSSANTNNVSSAQFANGGPSVIQPPPASLPISTEPSSSRPALPDETRAASSNALPAHAPSTPTTPTAAVPPLQTEPGTSSSNVGAPHSAYPPQPDDLSRHGTVAIDSPRHPDSLQGRREGPPGREVTFAEPERQADGLRRVNGVSQTSATGQAHAGAGQDEADQDAMDIDEPAAGDTSRLTSLRPPPLDTPRPPDVLSSPGSTTQTATTPAVHDASPDTSPDNGEPRYPADDDDLAPEEALKGTDDGADSRPGAEGAPSATTPSRAYGPTMPSAISSQANGAQQSAQSPSGPKSADASLEPNEATTQTAASSSRSSGQDEPLPAGSAASPSTALEKRIPPASVGHERTISSVPIHPPHDTGIIPDAMNSLPTQGQPSTPADSADLSHSVSGSQRRRHAMSNSWSRDKRHGRNLKLAPVVLFEKAPKKSDDAVVSSRNQGSRIPTDDYFVPLFLEGFARQSSWMKSPDQLLTNTHKTISSSDCNIVLHESQACKVLRRIYHLQQHDKWSLRQHKRCPEPIRPSSNWDSVLREAKWLRDDFRADRRWKMAMAQILAQACADWVASSDEERRALQVNAGIPASAQKSSLDHGAMIPPADIDSLPTPMPDLIPSNDADSPMDVDDEPNEWDQGTVAPSAIFGLQEDEVVFALQASAASDQLLDELPYYQAPLKVPQGDPSMPVYDPDARWRRPALPLIKYVETELVLKPTGSPLKLEQSRYKYAVEDEDSDSEFADLRARDESVEYPPACTDVALFRPEMKMIRDRLHSTHQFRPPSESAMPTQSFYEQRVGSLWTPADDDELKRQVREYSYNWSLISQNISSRSLFVSGEDRRTPWECFERWVSLEGFPPEVAKTQYFRTYHSRIDSAQRVINAAAQAAAGSGQASGQNGVVVPPQRRRPNLPARLDRKPNKRYFYLIGSMKSLAKKRETQAAKQQQTANNQNRRASENNPQKLPTKTPEDYSRLKAERERQMQEKIMRYTQAQQQQAQQAAMQQGRVPNQMARVPGAPGVAQVAQNAAAGHVGGMANPLAARLAGQGQMAAQARRMPMPPQQQAMLQLQQQQQQQHLAAQLRGASLGPQAAVNVAGMPQAHVNGAQAQPHLQPNANLLLEARRIQEQQRRRQLQMTQQQTQGQVHQHPSQQPGAQQQAQQLPPQHSPSQAQAQALPQNQQAHTLPNGTGAQGSPNMRASMGAVNGTHQNNFVMNNNMAYGPNGMAMASPPGGVGISMPNVPAGSPPAGYSPQPRGLPVSMQAHFAEVENQIRVNHPEASAAVIRQMALQRFHQVYRTKSNVAQTAMDAAAGNASLHQTPVNGIANASSPQQYAQLLRQQQQQQSGSQHAPQQQQQQQQQQHQAQLAQQAAQAAAAAQAHAAQAAQAQAAQAAQAAQTARPASQPSQPQHQRQPSGGGTPTPNR